ncbi:hypothetical protein QI349_02810 [Staphylococcus saprophyticus]|nr:hypothetical protein [Staphylococcus saprophyticus]
MNNVRLGNYLKITRLDGNFIEYGIIVKVVGREDKLLEHGEQETFIKTIMLDGTEINISEDDGFEVIDEYVISSLFMEG